MRRVRPSRAIVLCLIVGGLAPESARSQEELLQELRTIASVRIEGRRQIGPAVVERVMKTRDPSIWPWRERPVLRIDYLRSDVVAIEAVYRHHGFLDTRVEYRIASSRKPDEVQVQFLIHEGGRARVREVRFTGVQAIPEKELRRRLRVHPGRLFDPAFLQLDTLLLSTLYQERGYRPHAVPTATRHGADSLQILVHYEVSEGVQYRVGEIYISGQDRVRERLITRELVLQPGGVYQRSRVVRSQERLYESGLFSQVQIEPLPDSTRTLMNFDVRLRERRPRWIDAGIGSGTDERFRLTGEWGHRNLTGRGLQGGFASRLTFYGGGEFQRWLTSVSVLEPWLLRSRTRGQVTPFYERHDDRSDDRTVVRQEFKGLDFQLRRELNRFTRVTLAQKNVFAHQDVDIVDEGLDPATRDTLERTVVPNYTTHRLQLGLARDIRDNPFDPTRGSAASVAAEVAGGPLSGSSSFRRTEIVSSWYTPLPNGWTLATRARGGWIDPFGSRQRFSPDTLVDPEVARVPLEDRFNTGGVNSVRGHNENSIHPSGGLVVLQGNVELRIPTGLRIPFLGALGIETYLDAGNVWDRPVYVRWRHFTPTEDDPDPNAVRYVAGIGPRVQLPVGPLRIDFTWRLRPSTSSPRIQFAIGPSF